MVPGWEFRRALPSADADRRRYLRLGEDAPGDLLVWISDATGHGASAALLTTLSKLLFRHAAAEAQTPAAIMDYVEAEFQTFFKGHSFMTAACLLLQAGAGPRLFAAPGSRRC